MCYLGCWRRSATQNTRSSPIRGEKHFKICSERDVGFSCRNSGEKKFYCLKCCLPLMMAADKRLSFELFKYQLRFLRCTDAVQDAVRAILALLAHVRRGGGGQRS